MSYYYNKCITLLLGAGLIAVVACSSPEQRAQRSFERGKRMIAEKDYQRAILEFSNAVKLRQKDPEPRYQLALAYLGVGDYKSATGYLRSVIDLDPNHVATQIKIAELMTVTRDKNLIAEAETRLEKVLETAPENLTAAKNLAIAEWELGKQQEAEERLRAVVDKAPADLQATVTLSRMKLYQKDLTGAEELLKKAAQRTPPSADAYAILGNFYVRLGKPVEAESALRRALDVDPKHAPTLLTLASLRQRNGNLQETEALYKQVSSLPQKEYRAFYGLYLRRMNRLDDAIREFSRLLDKNAGDREVQTQLIWTYLVANRQSEAEKILKAAIAKNSQNSDALLQLATLHVRNGDGAAAEAELKQAIRTRPDWPEARYMLGQAYGIRNATTLQRQEYGEALRLNPFFLPARLQMAAVLIRVRDFTEALRVLDAAPGQDKQAASVRTMRNWALLGAGDFKQARESIQQTIATARTPENLRQDAILKMQARTFDEARKSLREALQKNGEDVAALSLLVKTYTAQNARPAAVKEAGEYVAQHPKSAAVQSWWGNFLMETGDLTQAQSAFESAKASSANPVAANLGLAKIHLQKGNMNETVAALNSVLAKNPENVNALVWMGEVEQLSNKHAAAAERYRKVLDLDPNNAGAMNNLAWILAENLKQPDQALKFAQRALELDPKNPRFQDTLGWVLYRKGLHGLAVEYLERAAKTVDDPRIKTHLAMAWIQNGQRDRGREALKTSLRVSSDYPEAHDARAVLEQTQ